MFAKVLVWCSIVVAAVARPDQAPQSYNYQLPQHQPASYQPPQQQATSYQAPQQQSASYQAPQQHAASYEAPSNRQQSYQQPESQDGMPFNYAYEVNDQYSGLDFGHNTNSDGKVTTGEYRVLLPDGRTQIVTYTVDGYNGYEAEVNYEGEAKAYEPQTSASYNQPRQTHEQPRQSYEQPNPSQSYRQPEKSGYGS